MEISTDSYRYYSVALFSCAVMMLFSCSVLEAVHPQPSRDGDYSRLNISGQPDMGPSDDQSSIRNKGVHASTRPNWLCARSFLHCRL